MGCDIHGWVEAKINNKWIAIAKLEDDGRCYDRFAKLAGVRGPGPSPAGIPGDVSDTAKFHINLWNRCAHSHSWLPLSEAFEIFKATDHKENYSLWDAFGVDLEWYGVDIDQCRLVFWFDS